MADELRLCPRKFHSILKKIQALNVSDAKSKPMKIRALNVSARHSKEQLCPKYLGNHNLNAATMNSTDQVSSKHFFGHVLGNAERKPYAIYKNKTIL
jgi:hypothetical protein